MAASDEEKIQTAVAPLVVSDYEGQKRTCYCGKLSEKDIDSRVTLMGWVNRQRDFGELVFIDLRDRTGMVQVVVDHAKTPDSFDIAKRLRSEYVICVSGVVVRRLPGKENPEFATGTIEVIADQILVFNQSKTPPFVIRDQAEPDESIRMRYRFIDLRRLPMLRNLEVRHKATLSVRNYLSDNGFWEVDTPSMTKTTPEGARDYLVPSRLEPGSFYALAQSPQIFKQLLMVSGVDKYFQIARCYRDEDLRADRQPEFTQIDIEMSFAKEEQVFSLVEGMIKYLWKDVLSTELHVPFPKITWDEAMNMYGSDKPDIRFDMKLHDISDSLRRSQFMVFKNTLKSEGVVKAICVKHCADWSRKDLDLLTDLAKQFGASGLIPIAYLPGGEVKSPIKRHLTSHEISAIAKVMGAQEGDLVLIVAGPFQVAVSALGRLRLELGERLKLIPQDEYRFLWVTDFPFLEKNEEDGSWQAAHHPFTSPVAEHVSMLDTNDDAVKSQIRARAYDLVLNGVELASGSVRIHRREVQEKVFNILGLTDSEAREKFGFLLEAFEYGSPPHCGIAFGMDRVVMLMVGANTIRDVIAFPKTARATCLLTGAPSQISKNQLGELGLCYKSTE